MKKLAKLIFFNLLLLTIMLVILELMFGNWFRRTPLDHLNIIRSTAIKVDVNSFYDSPNGTITYSRDANGLRGQHLSPLSDIDILTIGGSTTDQRYIDDQETWQSLLENAFAKEGKSIQIANAGVDGHSTFGHLKALSSWLSAIPELRPKYIIFYIGVNDFYITEGHIRDHLSNSWKERSAIYSALKKAKLWSQAKSFQLTHQPVKWNNIKFTKEGLYTEKYLDSLANPFKEAYAERIEQLITTCSRKNITPIFVTQPVLFYCFNNNKLVGVDQELVYVKPINGVDYYFIKRAMDNVLIKKAHEFNMEVIDIGSDSTWNTTDFYDYVHLNPTGTKHLAQVLFPRLNEIIKP